MTGGANAPETLRYQTAATTKAGALIHILHFTVATKQPPRQSPQDKKQA